MAEEYPNPSSSGLPELINTLMGEVPISELLFQNGQITQRDHKKPDLPIILREILPLPLGDEPSAAAMDVNYFMGETEMASWLQTPLDEPLLGRNMYSDIFYPQPAPSMEDTSWVTQCSPERLPDVAAAVIAAASPLPPLPESTSLQSLMLPDMGGVEEASSRVQNFGHFLWAKEGKEMAMLGSSFTPLDAGVGSSTTPLAAGVESSITPLAAGVELYGGSLGRGKEKVDMAGTSAAAEGGGRDTGRYENKMTSSPGGSGGSKCSSAELVRIVGIDDRKRKAAEVDDADGQSEDHESEPLEAKKQTRAATAKRSRAAEVHNLSERRRRDKINEKMKVLQDLIPHCNKSDKASMLDEAIEYLKGLQMQVQILNLKNPTGALLWQMMSMGSGMVPLMYPGMQQYMQQMGMGMEIGLNRPMMPFLPMMHGSALPNGAAPTHILAPRFPMPPFHLPSVPLPNISGAQATVPADSVISSIPQNLNQPRIPFFADPYQQYLGFQQVPLPQNQVMTQPSTTPPSTTVPSSTRVVGKHENPKTG